MSQGDNRNYLFQQHSDDRAHGKGAPGQDATDFKTLGAKGPSLDELPEFVASSIIGDPRARPIRCNTNGEAAATGNIFLGIEQRSTNFLCSLMMLMKALLAALEHIGLASLTLKQHLTFGKAAIVTKQALT